MLKDDDARWKAVMLFAAILAEDADSIRLALAAVADVPAVANALRSAADDIDPALNDAAYPWQQATPIEAGYYWLHDHVVPGRPRTFMVYFKDEDNVRVHGGAWLPAAVMENARCWWAGPIITPTLPVLKEGGA